MGWQANEWKYLGNGTKQCLENTDASPTSNASPYRIHFSKISEGILLSVIDIAKVRILITSSRYSEREITTAESTTV